jgi:ribosomal protein S18 acetylase RimI-like enzyme
LKARITSGLAKGWILDVATINERVVGFLATKPVDRVIDQLFVVPDVQRQGIGTALLNWAKRLIATAFTLRTPVTNMAAQRFYEKHGLRILQDEPHPVTSIPARYFEWRQ